MNNSALEHSFYLDSSLWHTEDTLNSRKEFRSGFVKACSCSRDQTQPSITSPGEGLQRHVCKRGLLPNVPRCAFLATLESLSHFDHLLFFPAPLDLGVCSSPAQFSVWHAVWNKI